MKIMENILFLLLNFNTNTSEIGRECSQHIGSQIFGHVARKIFSHEAFSSLAMTQLELHMITVNAAR